MPWFKVDDTFHAHPKIRKVAAKCPAALALWVVAGSWSSANLTDGFVSDTELPWLLPESEKLATELVAARLWTRVKGGYRFHEWLEFNPSAESVRNDRVAAKERMRKLRDQRKQQDPGSGEVRPNVRDVFVTPSRSSSRTSRRGTASPPAAAKPSSTELPKPHPFVDDGTGSSCSRCGLLRINKLHMGKKAS